MKTLFFYNSLQVIISYFVLSGVKVTRCYLQYTSSYRLSVSHMSRYIIADYCEYTVRIFWNFFCLDLC